MYNVVHLSANSARSIHYSSHQISFQAAETLTSSCSMNLQAPAGPPPPAVSMPSKSCKCWYKRLSMSLVSGFNPSVKNFGSWDHHPKIGLNINTYLLETTRQVQQGWLGPNES